MKIIFIALGILIIGSTTAYALPITCSNNDQCGSLVCIKRFKGLLGWCGAYSMAPQAPKKTTNQNQMPSLAPTISRKYPCEKNEKEEPKTGGKQCYMSKDTRELCGEYRGSNDTEFLDCAFINDFLLWNCLTNPYT